jgi:hypothetical protein
MANTNQICYCCLAETLDDDMKNMLKDKFDRCNFKLKLTDAYQTCSGINIDDDAFSQLFICRACETKLQASFQFRELCHNSHETMKGRLESALVDVKEEYESEQEIIGKMTFEITELTETKYDGHATDSEIEELPNQRSGPSKKDMVVTQLKCVPCNKVFSKYT